MKVFATIAVICAALSAVSSGQDYSEEETLKIIKNREDCITETKVNPELIDRADKGDFVDDDKLKCFTKCFYQKAGFVTETGGLLLDTIKAKIPASIDKDKALKVIEKCKQEGKDSCETVYFVHKCYFEHTHLRPELVQKQETAKVEEKTSPKNAAKKEAAESKKEEKKQ